MASLVTFYHQSSTDWPLMANVKADSKMVSRYHCLPNLLPNRPIHPERLRHYFYIGGATRSAKKRIQRLFLPMNTARTYHLPKSINRMRHICCLHLLPSLQSAMPRCRTIHTHLQGGILRKATPTRSLRYLQWPLSEIWPATTLTRALRQTWSRYFRATVFPEILVVNLTTPRPPITLFIAAIPQLTRKTTGVVSQKKLSSTNQKALSLIKKIVADHPSEDVRT